MRTRVFLLIAIAAAAAVFAAARAVSNDYVFFAGYTVLQFIVLATAWNILGGYTGYVNFGSAAFFALGAYSTVFLHKTFPLPIPVLIVIGGAVSGVVGFGMGYLTLRLRGAFFAIATLALAVVLQTLVVNWDYVGGSRGAYIIRPNEIALIGPYIQYLFLLMLALAVFALATARGIERSQLGYGFATIRDDELAAEASGVPTLRLKLVATTLSGALMGMAGAPFPYYIGYLQPSSAFGLEYAVNSIAMPMIGGTTSWVGPLIGAILLGTLQQVATVTISSAVNLLIVGLLLVDFVIIAPNGIVGLVKDRQAAFTTMAQPPVFSLLYILNLLPMYFLTGQGQAAQSIDVVFWAILLFVAYTRGGLIGRPWLVVFPAAGALLGVAPVSRATPVISTLAASTSFDVTTIVLALITLIQLIGLGCGLAPKPRLAEAPAA
jgi:branched-chain amino acid transport system permease protein